jgi:uncharacterized Rossmann fold enzyme
MFYKDWAPIYEKISSDFSFELENEKKSADFLNTLLKNIRIFSIKKLDEMISNKEIVIFGAGPSLIDSIDINFDKIKNLLKISVDGATSALLEKNIFPDIIVTDLDGKVSDQIKANSNGSIVIIHAHGDNYSNIEKYVPMFNKDIIGSIQIDPKQYENIINFGGFTDGDRAVFLATHFNAKKIYLIGFNYENKIGKYSLPEIKDIDLKIKKLKWCKKLIELLNEEYKNIYYL